MGIELIVALGSLAVGAGSAIASNTAQKKAAGAQEKIQGEQKAQNAAQAASERRSQVREERVRRARVMQSSENTGVGESSGEFGALGTLGTNLAVNMGSNAGKLAASERTSGYAQDAANFMGQAQRSDKLFNLSASIFSNSGGFNSIFGSSGAGGVTEATRTGRLPGTS